MTALIPPIAASLSSSVYALTKTETIDKALIELNMRFGDALSFTPEVMLKAKTGGPWFIKCRTAFGFTLIGSGKFKGHAFFLFRGTQYLADWLSNLNIGVSRSSTGLPVHDGFLMAFNSMLPSLKEFMGVLSKNNILHIHCIGHSLGGALATICAEWIKSSYQRSAYLYTFGSPRVGLQSFADFCTMQIGEQHIFRAYHKTDIVPCIPPWPFIHTPSTGQDYFLPSPGLIPMAEYHDMQHYIDSVKGKSWAALSVLAPEQKTDSAIEQWLKSVPVVNWGVAAIEWLNYAIMFVVKKCLKGAVGLLTAGISTTFTLLDQLSYILHKGIKISDKVSSLVLNLIRKIMEIMGMRRTLKAVDLTHDFIRNIFLKLHAKINAYAQQALSQVFVKSRAI